MAVPVKLYRLCATLTFMIAVVGCNNEIVPDVKNVELNNFRNYMNMVDVYDKYNSKCNLGEGAACFKMASHYKYAIWHNGIDYLNYSINRAKQSCVQGNGQGCDLLVDLLDRYGQYYLMINDKIKFYGENSVKDISNVLADEFKDVFEVGCASGRYFACANAYDKNSNFESNLKRYIDNIKKCTSKDDKCSVQLAQEYLRGRDLERNEEKAQIILRDACQQRGAESCFGYAMTILNENEELAKNLLEKSCRAGIDGACIKIAEINTENNLQYLEDGCLGGGAASCEKLLSGFTLKNNPFGFDKEMFVSSCINGNSKNCIDLAEREFDVKEFKSALEYLEIGALSRFGGRLETRKCQKMAARMLSEGTLVRKNLPKSIFYYKKACWEDDDSCYKGAGIALKLAKKDYKYVSVAKDMLGYLCDRNDVKACKKYNDIE